MTERRDGTPTEAPWPDGLRRFARALIDLQAANPGAQMVIRLEDGTVIPLPVSPREVEWPR